MKPIVDEQFIEYSYLANLKASPNERYFSYTKANARLKKNDYVHTLYLYNGTSHLKAFNMNQDSRYIWENDDNILYFTDKTNADKKMKKLKYSNIYRYTISKKKSSLAYTFPLPISNITIINKETILVHASMNEDDHQLIGAAHIRHEYLQELEANKDFETFEAVPFQSNGEGFSNGKIGQAFFYNIKKNEYTPLSQKNESVSGFRFNHDKSSIYYLVTDSLKTPNFYSDVYCLDLESLSSTKLYDKKDLKNITLIPLKESLYLFANDGKTHGVNQNNDFYSLSKGKTKKVVEFGLSSNPSVGTDVRFGGQNTDFIKEDEYYFLGTLRDKVAVYRFDGKTVENLFAPEGSLDSLISFDNKFFSIGLFNDELQELYKVDLEEKSLEVISKFNMNSIRDSYSAKAIHHEYENDGQTLDGWVLLPEKFDKNKTYPSILNIHGGPKTVYGPVFSHEMQMWASDGYIVYFCNPRGGDSYGDDFANIRGKYGTIDYEDIMAFTDLVEKEYPLDKDRMGVTGGSYGGFMTNWIVSHTDRFKAAATQRSISNWISFYGTSDIGPYFGPDQTEGDPLDDLEKVWEQSPLKHARNIKTPLLFIHSDADYRCPIEQAMQLYTAITMNGVESKFVWFKGENHDLSRSGKPQARLKRLKEIKAWMDLHLKNK